MEQNEFLSAQQSQPESESVFDLSLSPSIAYSLKETCRWASIFAYICLGVLVLLLLFALVAWATMSNVLYSAYGGEYGSYGALMGVVFVVIFGIYGTLLALLLRFSIQVKRGFIERNLRKIETGVASLKFYFVTSGILSAVFLVFVALTLVLAMVR